MRRLAMVLLGVCIAVGSPLAWSQQPRNESHSTAPTARGAEGEEAAQSAKGLREADGAGEGPAVQQWKLRNAMPTKFVGPQPKSSEPQ